MAFECAAKHYLKNKILQERWQEKLDNGCQADPVPVFQKHIEGLGPGYYPVKAQPSI
jgi:hypothetical protein